MGSRNFEFVGVKQDHFLPFRHPALGSGASPNHFIQESQTVGRGPRAQHELQALVAEANHELEALLHDAGEHLQFDPHGEPVEASADPEHSELLQRAVRCALKQYRLQAELNNLALTDDLTGLHNRRGFFALAERQLKIASRSSRSLLLFFIDVNGLKPINDSLGHSTGDLALIRAAQTLEKTFRDSDVLARFGGDEFAVLAIEADGHSEAVLRERLQENLDVLNSLDFGYVLSLSLGVARFDPMKTTSLGELMFQADQAMYEHKRHAPKTRPSGRTVLVAEKSQSHTPIERGR